jgi:hypothetical protein
MSSGGTNPTFYCNTETDIHINCIHTKQKDELIKKAMSELGKRSAKKNKRDYSAMGKKGALKRWKKCNCLCHNCTFGQINLGQGVAKHCMGKDCSRSSSL